MNRIKQQNWHCQYHILRSLTTDVSWYCKPSSSRLAFCNMYPNFNPHQPAYRKLYSAETSLLSLLDSVYHAANNGFATFLLSFDLSSAFDIVYHAVCPLSSPASQLWCHRSSSKMAWLLPLLLLIPNIPLLLLSTSVFLGGSVLGGHCYFKSTLHQSLQLPLNSI